ncbi:MAG: IclR family transcriptional regulator C-terminal domain-containing protein, partial [Acidobacteria bacterium]|nr:IclR family transcriptional regulator C-terminal domain-containing protein [Acidobacteriota bacterium]
AHLPRTEVEAILRQHGLKKRTPKTIVTPSRFFVELEKVRLQGYAVDDEENSLGARCLAVPIFDGLGRVEAAMGISGTSMQMDDERLPKYVEVLRESARRLSRQLARSSKPVV